MTFIQNEAGAVTVDWVVLTAGLVGLGLAAMSVVNTGVEDLSNDTASVLTGYQIQTSFTRDCSGYSEDCLWESAVAFYDMMGQSIGTREALVSELNTFLGGTPSEVAALAYGDPSNYGGDLWNGVAVYEVMKDYTGTPEDQLALAQLYGEASYADLEATVAADPNITDMDMLMDFAGKQGDFFGQFRLAAIEEAELQGLTVNDI